MSGSGVATCNGVVYTVIGSCFGLCGNTHTHTHSRGVELVKQYLGPGEGVEISIQDPL